MSKLQSLLGLRLLRLIGHVDWIRFGIRYRIISRFCNADIVQSHPFEIKFFGFVYQGNLNCYIDWSVYFFGAYEKNELFMLRDLLKGIQNPVFLDIGANIGHHSLFMSQYCGQILAIEPYELVRKQLELKIKTNQIQNIQVHPLGLGQADAELDFYAPKGSNTGTGSFVATHDTENNALFGKLKIVDADEYIFKQSLKKINLIKMDVEGFEKNVLTGMKATLEKYRPILFMEFSADTQQTFQNELEMMSLLPTNYAVRRVRVDRPFGYFFNQGKHYFESFDFNSPGGNIIFFPKDQVEKIGIQL